MDFFFFSIKPYLPNHGQNDDLHFIIHAIVTNNGYHYTIVPYYIPAGSHLYKIKDAPSPVPFVSKQLYFLT